MLYDVIKEICDEKHIRISALEREAGLGNGTISKWKTCKYPNLPAVYAIAKVLDVSVDDLCESMKLGDYEKMGRDRRE